MTKEHDKIWLQPWCDDCERMNPFRTEGRLWCQDNVWEPCKDCGAEPVMYVRARKKED